MVDALIYFQCGEGHIILLLHLGAFFVGILEYLFAGMADDSGVCSLDILPKKFCDIDTQGLQNLVIATVFLLLADEFIE